MKIGIFGGTFHPFHNGHLALIRRMHDALGLERVLVIPAFEPPHKRTENLPDGTHRMRMCEIATEGLAYVTVSNIELRRGGKSYTVDTLRLLRVEYPGDELVLLMGGDSFLAIETWYEYREILRLAEIAALARESGEEEKLLALAERLNASGARTCAVTGYGPLVASSTEARAGDLSLVPAAVTDYIVQNGLYGHEIEIPLDLDELTAYLRAHLSHKRFMHTLNVASEAIRLAKAYGADGRLAYLAGLLHDVCKELPKAEQLAMLAGTAEHDDPAFLGSPPIWHGYAAAVFAEKEFGVHNVDILNAVRYHTTGRGEMSRLEEVVYLADLISAERSFPGVEALRAKAYRSLNAAMLESLSFSIGEMTNLQRHILPETVRAYNRYLIAAAAETDAPASQP